MKLFYDLHIHSALSPCADEEMTPNNIINMSLIKELDVIAVADHNSILNQRAIVALGEKNGLLVIPAIEVQTIEDVHVLCLFRSIDDIESFYGELDPFVIKVRHKKEKFGTQKVLDEDDEIISECEHSLLAGTTISLGALRELAAKHGGLFIPAHIDKKSYSLLANLGYIPSALGPDAVEVFGRNSSLDYGYRMIYNSDAHSLHLISEPENYIEVKDRSIEAIFDYFEVKSERS